MITADQLVAHAIGDYILQSDWMASKKRTESAAAFAHALTYTLCFLPWLLTSASGSSAFWRSFVICATHYLIDRYGLARYVVWAKNFLAPRWMELGAFVSLPSAGNDAPPSFYGTGTYVRNLPWSQCQGTGYPTDRPPFLAVWLLIIADNVLHVLINGAALRWL